MPQIRITEIDNTSNSTEIGLSNIVFIPGRTGKIAERILKQGDIALIESIEDFEIKVGKEFPKDESALGKKECAYQMARALLENGMNILFYSLGKADAYVESDKVSVKQAIDYLLASDIYTQLGDKSKFNVRFITEGGYCGCHEGDEGMSQANAINLNRSIAEAAGARGDCLGLLNYRRDLEEGSSQVVATNLKEFVTSMDSDEKLSKNGKYCAMFAPYMEHGDKDYPAYYDYLLCYIRSIQKNASWFAVAGSNRGVVSGTPRVEFGDVESKILQNSGKEMDDAGYNAGFSINPICYIYPYGYLIWGNRTLNKNGNEGLIASSFLNIRQLCIDIKQTLWKAARKYTFEPNSDVLWVNFCNQITPLLDSMKNGQGIVGYSIFKNKKCVNGELVSIKPVRGRLTALIHIVPIEAVEDFDLTVELSDTVEVEG